ncbi:hypothetical protein FISHEDRAFT_73409 [Fistulina hepatica ATCC 64428]|uniref:Uncharacterized protein n=1 Tax=Fistulina hepatica ATCC 64428 TaxID=1128425 RepID=A0A0D7AFJ5_9AGAR|nr:hypothetical protein FISHEDRAFT_73409 [Fistulina hepatica ATCC 64428]
MRISLLPLVVAGVGLLQVNAIPLRLIVLSNGAEAVPSDDIATVVPSGDAATFHDKRPAAMLRPLDDSNLAQYHHAGCGGAVRRFREKALSISNAFRQALGMPLIQPESGYGRHGHGRGRFHDQDDSDDEDEDEDDDDDGDEDERSKHRHHHHKHFKMLPSEQDGDDTIEDSVEGEERIRMHKGKLLMPLPFIGTPQQLQDPDSEEGDPSDIPTDPPVGPPPSRHHRHHHLHHMHKRPGSFIQRVHLSLLTLGPWEGRAVAFVLGCGIGVLLRMLWVLAVIIVRTIKNKREDQHEHAEVIFAHFIDEEGPVTTSQPSQYPSDNKVDPDATVVA